MPLYGRPFRGSHRERLERLQRYATLISLHNSTFFAQTLQSEQPTIIDLLNDDIAFTDQEESDDSSTPNSNVQYPNKQLQQQTQLTYGSSCGLYNPGQNICFMNAVIQTLINLPYITPCLLSGLHKASCKLRSKSLFCSLCLLESLAQKAHSIKGAVNNPFFSITKKAIWSRYVPGKQQDSHEFLRYLVESFSTPMGAKSAPDSYKRNLIGQAFHGTLKTTVKCLQCKYTSEKLENFLDIALDITKESLENCIAEFIQPQQLTGSNKYHCPKCKNKRDATISLNFGKLPVVLCIALKRFNSGIFGLEKTFRSLKYPQHMDLNGINYELSALVCHLGHSLYSGHYVAYARAGHGFWNKFDDSHVSLSEKHQVLEQAKSAYLLFYVQQNVTNYEQLLINSVDKLSSVSKRKNETKTASDRNKKGDSVHIIGIKNSSDKNSDIFNPFMRMEKSKDLTSQYGIHEVSTWDGVECDTEAIRRHSENSMPKIAKRDQMDIEYDMGKLKKVRNKHIFKGVTEIIGDSKTKQLVINGRVDFDKINNKHNTKRNNKHGKVTNNDNSKGVTEDYEEKRWTGKGGRGKKWRFHRKK